MDSFAAVVKEQFASLHAALTAASTVSPACWSSDQVVVSARLSAAMAVSASPVKWAL